MNKEFKSHQMFTLGYLLGILGDAQKCDCKLPANTMCSECEVNGGDLVEAMTDAINNLREVLK